MGTKIEKDQVVKFQYKKSDGKVSERVVLVNDINKTNLEGLDINAKGYRNFKLANVSKLKILAKSKDDILPVFSTPENTKLCSGDDLAVVAKDVWNDIYSEVRYVKDIDSLVMTHSNNLRVEVDFWNSAVKLTINGKCLRLIVNDFGYVKDIQVEGKSLGRKDINILIGALEVLSGE